MSPLPTHMNGVRKATFPLSNSSRQKPRKFVLLCMFVWGRANAGFRWPLAFRFTKGAIHHGIDHPFSF